MTLILPVLSITVMDEFNEALHPRDDHGRFGEGSGEKKGKTTSQIKQEARATFKGLGAVKAYAKLPGTDGGRKIDIDAARELDPNYVKDPTRVAGIHHEVVAAFADKMFENRMKQPPLTKDEHVVFLAGGGGSGKSTIRDAFKLDAGAHTLWDGTMSHYESAKEKIDMALKSGRKVVYDVVLCPPEKAVRQAIIRANESGRAVGIDILARAHEGSPSTAFRLMNEFKGDKRISFRVFVNDGKVKDVREIQQPPTTRTKGIVKEYASRNVRESVAMTYRDIAERGYENQKGQHQTLKPAVKDTLEASSRRLEGRGTDSALGEDSGCLEEWLEESGCGLSITVDGDFVGHEFHGNQHMDGNGVRSKENNQRNHARVQQIVMAEVQRQGFPGVKVSVVMGPKEQSVNGKNFEVAGDYDFNTGQLRIYADNLHDTNRTQIRGVVSHEVGHAIFAKAEFTHSKDLMAKLQKDDGVTPYSRDYWKGLKDKSNSKDLALHETFAEIHMLHSTDRARYDKSVKPLWKALYRDVMSRSKVGAK